MICDNTLSCDSMDIFINIANNRLFDIYCTKSFSCSDLKIDIVSVNNNKLDLDYNLSIWYYKDNACDYMHLYADDDIKIYNGL